MMWTRWKTISSPPAEHWLDLADRRIRLVITVRPQAQRMTLRMARRGAEVALTLPPRSSVSKGLEWARSKTGWIESQLARRPAAQVIEPGMTFDLAGEPLLLDWSEAYPRTAKRMGHRLRIGGPRDALSVRLVRWLRAEAKAVLAAETARYAALAGVTVSAVSVGDPVSRWGSCSSSGAIRYSWRLILAPRFVIEATVAHEVAHRIHMNHGPQFHALVTDLLGHSPEPARRWLRANGSHIQGFGAGS